MEHLPGRKPEWRWTRDGGVELRRMVAGDEVQRPATRSLLERENAAMASAAR